jgi:hypothetical protein
MAGAGADRVTVRGEEPGCGDAAPASVPTLTKPASAQPGALEFPRYPDPAHRDVPQNATQPGNTRSDSESPIGPAVTPA